MKILVSGASGFLGKFLCKRLKRENHEIIELNSKNCDLTDQEALKQFSSYQFDLIYHLAAWTQAGDFCIKYPADQWIINQKINTNMLFFWKEYQPQAKIICMGTSCSYDPHLQLKEENYLLGKPIDSLYTYAMCKRMLLAGLIAINKQLGLDYLYLVPSTLYGPSYHEDGRQMHFIFDLIRKIIRAKYINDTAVLWGDGNQVRELIHVDDFVDIMFKLTKSEKNQIFNIGAGRGYQINEFAKKISKLIDYDPDLIKYDISKYVGAKSKILDTTKINKLLPSLDLKPIEEGLQDVIDWFLAKKEFYLKT